MMGSEERYARLAARVLREDLVQEAPERPDEQRDRVVAAMAVAIAVKHRRRKIVLGAGVALAAAATLVVMVKVWGHREAISLAKHPDNAMRVEHQFGSGNSLVRATATGPLPDLGLLAVGDTIRSDDNSSSLLGFVNGTRIAVSRSSQLRVEELGKTKRFSLLAGHLQAHVTKLTSGERFIVDTPDSEVEVRGTVFGVNVEGPSEHCRRDTTTVEVSEGAVWVRARNKQVVLHPGETWTVPCAEAASSDPLEMGAATKSPSAPSMPAPAARAPLPEPLARTAPHKLAARSAGTPVATTPSSTKTQPAAEPAPSERAQPPTPVSSLAEQNDLLSAAMSSERQGQHDMALRRLDLLIERYPEGPLLETARAERQRIMSAQMR
jgi:hypothetical protein